LKRIAFNENRIRRDILFNAAALLKRGGVIIYPTETIYGIGGNALRKKVHDRITRIKKRASDRHFIVLVKNLKMIRQLGLCINRRAMAMARAFWPGPLTLVLESTPATPVALRNRSGGVAVRISSSPFIRKLFDFIDFPLISTSCNISQSSRKIEKNLCDLELDCGPLNKHASTVVDARNSEPVVLRAGAISSRRIKRESK
jgi:L-threonylcarbamoyladenylate synthase